jgi:hypothetical protein
MPEADKPDWWSENEEIKAQFDLPTYEPPRFEDGTYTHDVVPKLESQFECRIRFVAIDPRYPEDWEVRVDGAPALDIGRRRDNNGNTVYQQTASEFESALRDQISR